MSHRSAVALVVHDRTPAAAATLHASSGVRGPGHLPPSPAVPRHDEPADAQTELQSSSASPLTQRIAPAAAGTAASPSGSAPPPPSSPSDPPSSPPGVGFLPSPQRSSRLHSCPPPALSRNVHGKHRGPPSAAHANLASQAARPKRERAPQPPCCCLRRPLPSQKASATPAHLCGSAHHCVERLLHVHVVCNRVKGLWGATQCTWYGACGHASNRGGMRWPSQADAHTV